MFSCWGMPGARKEPLESLSRQEMQERQADPGSAVGGNSSASAVSAFIRSARAVVCAANPIYRRLFLLRSVDIIKRLSNDGRTRVV